MKTVRITANDKVIATLAQPPELSDKDYEELKTALVLTLANWTGLQLSMEESNESN